MPNIPTPFWIIIFGVGGLVVLACLVVMGGAVRQMVLDRRDNRAERNASLREAATAVLVEAGTPESDAPDDEEPQDDESGFREAITATRKAYLFDPTELARIPDEPRPFSDPTDTFQVDTHTLKSVAQNLVFVDAELGRSYSDIPEDVPATDPWLNDAEIRESTEIAMATIAAISDAEAHIPDRSGDVLGDSWAKTQLRRINASLTDPMVADALIAHDPMMAFLLPVSADEPLPDFDESASVWASRNRIDEGHDIDGNSISWHTGFTRAMPTLRQRALESGKSAR